MSAQEEPIAGVILGVLSSLMRVARYKPERAREWRTNDFLVRVCTGKAKSRRKHRSGSGRMVRMMSAVWREVCITLGCMAGMTQAPWCSESPEVTGQGTAEARWLESVSWFSRVPVARQGSGQSQEKPVCCSLKIRRALSLTHTHARTLKSTISFSFSLA